jgi:hypothetical protein
MTEKNESRINLRDRMPLTAAFVDDLRQAFGEDGINASIRAGLRGWPHRFYAEEGGQQIGTPPPMPPEPIEVIRADRWQRVGD